MLKIHARAGVAQSVEQGTENPRVSGSIPLPGISFNLHSRQPVTYHPFHAAIFNTVRIIWLRLVKRSGTRSCLIQFFAIYHTPHVPRGIPFNQVVHGQIQNVMEDLGCKEQGCRR